MAINPQDSAARIRLAKSLAYSHQQLKRYHLMRADTIQAYLGVRPDDSSMYYQSSEDYHDQLPQGNLLQLAAISHQISLAYGDLEFLAEGRTPDKIGTAENLEMAQNRMIKLLDGGETSRRIAADSFFGYGVAKVGIGRLPLAAQSATGLTYGPCYWRVGQEQFLYDMTARHWNDVAIMGDWYMCPVDEAVERFPQHADRLQRATAFGRMDSPTVHAHAVDQFSAQPMVLLFDAYFPGTNVVGTWDIRPDSFGGIEEPPLGLQDFDGHWSGVYSVLTHLYSPDELVPVSMAESFKGFHYLFNRLLKLTADQALTAKFNPLYTAAAEKDMEAVWNAEDRVPVGVMDPTRFGQFESPGPTQSQTAYLAATMSFFKEMTLNLDQRLGLAPSAGTATQAQLLANAGDGIIQEMRRKFNKTLQMVGYKLGHLLMNSPELALKQQRPLVPGSQIPITIQWPPPGGLQDERIDDYDINIEPRSLEIRTPEIRLQRIYQMASQMVPLFQARQQGAPINPEEILKTFARLSGERDLLAWFEELDPEYTMQKQQSRATAKRADVGQYVRHNTSERTNAGNLTQSLTQTPGEGSAPGFQFGV